MSKNQLIGITTLFALAVLGGYLFLRQTAISPPPASPVKQTNSATSLPTPVVVTNTQPVVATSTPAPSEVKVSPDKARLLKLVANCQVESIDFGASYDPSPFRSAKTIKLKDGSLFSNPGVVNATEAHDLWVLVKDKCPFRIYSTIMDR